MSVLSQQNVQCETIQDRLDDDFVICTPPSDPMPFLESVLATQKAAGIQQKVSDGNGKVKTVKVVYDQRALESDANETTGTRTCDSTNDTYDNFTTYTIDPSTHISYSERIKVADLATVCQDFGSFYAKKIAKVIDVIERKIATKLSNAVVPLVGKWGSTVGSGSTVGTFNNSDELIVSTLISAATKAIDYTGMSEIDLALMQTGYCQSPIIVGGSALFQYGQFINKGCCSTTGVNVLDMARDFGKALLYDKRVASALGSDLKSIVYQPGSLAVITYNEFNEVPIVGANYDKFKVFSPRTGLPIDIVIKDDCGTISITGYATTKLVGLPTDIFAVGDEYRGVNFVNKILVTNPA